MISDSKFTFFQDPDHWTLEVPGQRCPFEELLLWGYRNKASDIDISTGSPVWMRIQGDYWPVTKKLLSDNAVNAIVRHIERGNDSVSAAVRSGKPRESSYVVNEDRRTAHRFRVNYTARTLDERGISIALRHIPGAPPVAADLGLPQAFIDGMNVDNGIILVTGKVGTGKSTTLAAMLRHLLETRREKLITYEDPIEFNLSRIPNRMGLVEQSEVGAGGDIAGWDMVIPNAARRASQSVFVGEMRNKETMHGLIGLAESGQRCFATLHTDSVASTPTRIINAYPADERSAVYAAFCSSVRMIIQQRLHKNPITGGRVPVWSWLVFERRHREQMSRITEYAGLPHLLDRFVNEDGMPLWRHANIRRQAGDISAEDYEMILRESKDQEVESPSCGVTEDRA